MLLGGWSTYKVWSVILQSKLIILQGTLVGQIKLVMLKDLISKGNNFLYPYISKKQLETDIIWLNFNWRLTREFCSFLDLVYLLTQIKTFGLASTSKVK